MSIRSISGGRAIAAAMIVALVGLGSLAGARLRAAPAGRCESVAPSTAGRAALVRGGTVVSGVGDVIVTRGSTGRTVADAPVPGGVARHFASGSGVGTAYVLDRSGDDRVVVVDPSGVDVITETGEASHPAWSSDGSLVWSLGSELRLRSPDGTRIRSIAAPRGAEGVFSPTFLTSSRLVAVVSERVEGPHADAALDNLWGYDLVNDGWHRLTAFTAGGERWSAIRTPIRAGDGRIEFVRVRGVASATEDVSYQLWAIAGSRVFEVEELPREMYLAGIVEGHRLWNEFDVEAGEWRLLRGSADGSLDDLGCGRVQVDPRGQADPDLGIGAAAPLPSPSPTVTSTPVPTGSPTAVPPTPSTPSGTAAPLPTPDPGETPSMAILVGDFSSLAAAEEVASRVRLAFGDAVGVAVVDNAHEPMAVAPGVWAVVMPVAPGSDVAAALEAFRAVFPEYAGWSWMVAI